MSHRPASPYRRQRNPSVIVATDGGPGQILPGRGPSLCFFWGGGEAGPAGRERPGHIQLLGAERVTLEAQGIVDLVHKSLRRRFTGTVLPGASWLCRWGIAACLGAGLSICILRGI